MANTNNHSAASHAHEGREPTSPSGTLSSDASPFRGVKLGTLGGVEIVADWSLLLIFALVTFNLGAGVFPAWHPEWSSALSWLTALAAAGLFWCSILLHEMTHAWVGRAQGMQIRRITLFLFGGAAHLETEPKSPKAELLMAGSGPVCSALIGIVAIYLGTLLAGPALSLAVESGEPAAAMSQLGPAATLLLWLGPVNLLLAVFNIIPGFPLDGGRMLRSLLWLFTGDLIKATRWASAIGRAVALALMAWGAWTMFTGAFLSGFWLVMIGWFLSVAAVGSYQQLLSRTLLRDVPVDAIMRTQLIRVAPNTTIEEFVRDFVMKADQQAFPVEVHEHLVGLVTFDDVKKARHSTWTEAAVSDVMTPVEQLSLVSPESAAADVLKPLAARGDQIPVMRGSHLVGMIQRADVMKWLALNERGRAEATG